MADSALIVLDVYLAVTLQFTAHNIGDEFSLLVDHQATLTAALTPGAVRDLFEIGLWDSARGLVFADVGGEPGATAASLLMAAFTPLNPPAFLNINLHRPGAARTALVGAVDDFATQTTPQVRCRRRRRHFSGAAELHGVDGCSDRYRHDFDCAAAAEHQRCQYCKQNGKDVIVHQDSPKC